MSNFDIMTLDQSEIENILIGLIMYTNTLKAGLSSISGEELSQMEEHLEKVEKSMFKLKQHMEKVKCIS